MRTPHAADNAIPSSVSGANAHARNTAATHAPGLVRLRRTNQIAMATATAIGKRDAQCVAERGRDVLRAPILESQIDNRIRHPAPRSGERETDRQRDPADCS